MAGAGYTDCGAGEKRALDSQHFRCEQLLGFAQQDMVGGSMVLNNDIDDAERPSEAFRRPIN